MQLSTRVARRDVARAYVTSVALLAALAVVLHGAGAESTAFSVATVVALGPLGLAVALVVLVPFLLVVVAPWWVTGALCIACALGVAVVNVRIVRRLTRPRDPAVLIDADDRRSRRGPPGTALDTTLSILFFVLAGCAFVVLCFVDGFAALTAHGVDFPETEEAAARTLAIAAWTWWPGLVLAIAGLVVWITRARQRRPSAPWAAVELGVMVGLVVICVAMTDA